MRFNMLCDANWESRVDQVLNALSDFGFRPYFQERNYGTGLDGITVVFMCRDPRLNFQQRIRFSKKEKKLYMDIMLDLPVMVAADMATKTQIIIERLINEVPQIVLKYKSKILDFDADQFNADLKAWIDSIERHSGDGGEKKII